MPYRASPTTGFLGNLIGLRFERIFHFGEECFQQLTANYSATSDRGTAFLSIGVEMADLWRHMRTPRSDRIFLQTSYVGFAFDSPDYIAKPRRPS